MTTSPSLKSSDRSGVRITRDANGFWQAVLENRHLRAEYRAGITNDHHQTYVRSFVIKGECQGNWLDAAAYRTTLSSAKLVHDAPEVQTVRLEWAGNKFEGGFTSEVSIYPDRPFLKVDYFSAAFPHICDLGTPGGRKKGMYVLHGAKAWQEQRSEIEDAELRNHPNEHHRLTDDLYPVYPNPLIDRNWAKQSALDYNGWYILGVYDKTSGRGFGRVVPARVMTYMKLLWGRGFELFPYWREKHNWRPYSTYLFVVEEGAAQVLHRGRAIADAAGPPREPTTASAVHP